MPCRDGFFPLRGVSIAGARRGARVSAPCQCAPGRHWHVLAGAVCRESSEGEEASHRATAAAAAVVTTLCVGGGGVVRREVVVVHGS